MALETGTLYRISPDRDDDEYFNLSDLLKALKSITFEPDCKILDFGCGNSPYESIIPHHIYHKADFGDYNANIDFEVKNNKIPDATTGYYDYVLSIQVLEHVESVSEYLSEAKRVLKDNGKIILTTHGSYKDHPFPADYWRWTADGLALEIERNGFNVLNVYKLTGGNRFAFIQLEQSINSLASITSVSSRIVVKIMRKIFYLFRTKLLKSVENESERTALHLVTPIDAGPDRYIGIMIVAEKNIKGMK